MTVRHRMNNLWGRPPGLSGWACSPRIVMKTPRWGRPSARGGLSGRPDALSITYGRFSTVRGSSRTRSSRQAGVDAGRRTGVLPYTAMLLCAILAGCGGSLTRNGPIDPALAVFIPPDTVALAGVRMDRLRATPIYRKLAERNRLAPFDQFRMESGFDPSRVLHEILLAGVRMDRLRATPIYRKLAERNRLPRFDQFRAIVSQAQDSRHFTFHYAFTVKNLPAGKKVRVWMPAAQSDARSEEHTSELQS